MNELDDLKQQRARVAAQRTAKRAELDIALADAVEISLENRVDQLELAVLHLPAWIHAVTEKVVKLRSEMYRLLAKKAQ